jgi:hypothetical protein
MIEQPPSTAPASPKPLSGNERVFSIVSLVIGIINLCAWLLPICGVPLGIVGLVLGYFGMRDVSQKTLAIVGMVLSGIGLLLACGNAVVGVGLNVLGPQIGDVFSSINSSLQP